MRSKYNKRGTAEQWIKEGKQAVKMTRLSCHKFRSNEVRLWLTIIAYNLGNLMATASAATENRERVLDEPPAAAGENRRTARKTRTVLLAPASRGPFDPTAVCQHAGADRWIGTPVGIAWAKAHKKTMPLSPKYGELSEKAGFGC